MRVEYGEDPDDLRSMFDQLIRTFAAKELKKAIHIGYVEQLKQK